ncbi:MAG: hypothetical protein JHC26_07010 [Thermofilum sp.]|jgi:hypothetical protein|uniref:hypothetical protein n=1 Tax=Thermofilum sp. TaxID=1961369 RepID=UPI00258317EE|nr:hypothetical protein [Thermofilum sp.]MCI4408825.1 hypothetical protein [Thermofilum sp.]
MNAGKGSVGMRVEEFEKRASEIVKQAIQSNICAVPRVEFFGGEDDGGNETYDYWQGLGYPLEKTRDALSETMQFDVFGVYATPDGISVQCHMSVYNDQGNPVKDYGWVPHLSALLAEEHIPEEKIIPALEEDIKELEHKLDALKSKPVTSHRIEKPYEGHVIAFCPICKQVLRPSCKDIKAIEEVLVYNHEHQPTFIILKGQGRKREVKYTGALAEGYQDLFEIIQTLWLVHGEGPRAIGKVVSAWLSLKSGETRTM